jgi:small conductance mechanosensitive channel
MKRLIISLIGLLLFIAPSLAQDAAHSREALEAKSVSEIEAMVPAALGELSAADAEWSKARTASHDAPDDAELKAAVAPLTERRQLALANARSLRDVLKAKSADVSELSRQILEISADAAKDGGAEAIIGVVARWTASAKEHILTEGPTYGIRALLFLVILFVFRVISKIAGGIVHKALSHSRLNISELLKKFFVGMVQKIVFFAGLLIALGQVGVDTGPLLAGVGVVGFVVGFALQDTLGNFAAGIMILLYRPFDVGNVITAGGETGKVEDLTLVSTTLLTPDNQKLILPNSAIWGGTIRNITAQKTRRVDFTIGVGYGDDLDKAQRVLMEVATSHELVLKEPAPQVEVVNLGESSVDFIVRPWANTGDYWKVYFDLTKAFKQRLDAEGISIPFPQRDLHLISVPEKLQAKS